MHSHYCLGSVLQIERAVERLLTRRQKQPLGEQVQCAMREFATAPQLAQMDGVSVW